MIRLARCTQASKAGTYFRNHLAVGDNQARPAAPSASFRASWIGTALPDLKLGADRQPIASHLVRLGRGLHPTDKVRLAPAKNRKRAYYDVTISPSKTVSLGALLEPSHPAAYAILNAHQRAVTTVTRMIGTMVAPARQDAPKADKWLAAVFHHSHTREGDPHLHTHAVLPNVMRNVEGEWRAMQVNISGKNRSRLELAYASELALQLRRAGFGPSLAMLPNGTPELRPLRPLVRRFSRATMAVLAAGRKKDGEPEPPAKPARVGAAEELHSRSGVPVHPDRVAIRRRRRLADAARKPKPKDADDPVRLSQEADRWKRALSDQEYRVLADVLAQGDYSNPKRVKVLDKLPPAASVVVQAAWERLGPDQRITAVVLMRAAVAESAGNHGYEELRQATNARLAKHKAGVRRVLARIRAEDEAISVAAYEALLCPVSGAIARPAAAPAPPRPPGAASESPSPDVSGTPTRSGRSARR